MSCGCNQHPWIQPYYSLDILDSVMWFGLKWHFQLTGAAFPSLFTHQRLKFFRAIAGVSLRIASIDDLRAFFAPGSIAGRRRTIHQFNQAVVFLINRRSSMTSKATIFELRQLEVRQLTYFGHWMLIDKGAS
jgi:hypothetical protein